MAGRETQPRDTEGYQPRRTNNPSIKDSTDHEFRDFHGIMTGKNKKHTGSVKQWEFYNNKKYQKAATDLECDNN